MFGVARDNIRLSSDTTTRRTLRYLVIMVACSLLVVALPRIFLPKRWQEIHPGQHRAGVIAVLGIPDADYFNAKQFDGWFTPFFIGTSTMTVRYGHNKVVVDAVQIRARWGLSYRTWERGYKKEIR